MGATAEIELTMDFQAAIALSGVPSVATFEDAARHALSGLKNAAEFTLRLVGRREARRLNRQFRGYDRPTNVLSFPAEGIDDVLPTFLGDIVICVPLAKEEARIQAKTFRAHCLHLSVHGLLHLVGFDHIEDREAATMEARECEVMMAMGFPDPYTQR